MYQIAKSYIKSSSINCIKYILPNTNPHSLSPSNYHSNTQNTDNTNPYTDSSMPHLKDVNIHNRFYSSI